jgi:hypothetical protein
MKASEPGAGSLVNNTPEPSDATAPVQATPGTLMRFTFA